MATVAVTKPAVKEQQGRSVFVSAPMGAGDDCTPIKGLLGNDCVVVGLGGTVTSVMPQTRMTDTDAWLPCLTAVAAAAGSVALFNVMDQLRVAVTTGTAVVATVLVRRS
jgi:hypothetical protein